MLLLLLPKKSVEESSKSSQMGFENMSTLMSFPRPLLLMRRLERGSWRVEQADGCGRSHRSHGAGSEPQIWAPAHGCIRCCVLSRTLCGIICGYWCRSILPGCPVLSSLHQLPIFHLVPKNTNFSEILIIAVIDWLPTKDRAYAGYLDSVPFLILPALPTRQVMFPFYRGSSLPCKARTWL